ncbi:hypothetical protein SAMN04488120_102264 [Fontimonas thermophila]|uniref:Uncharacterized protein n=1 Tax=Fontimonas thermophila TaxID=1076937 RepID=A0A1I2HWK2_9GAMM|nr:hypothetical protein [Fontimonas thermophila]SFF33750.1 hypothetical protein SAMN04488120_102264 [Fontimonas thermophila]
MTRDALLERGRTLRELDQAAHAPKGSAFRAFKHLAERFEEDRDYVVLHHERDRARIEALRARQRIYAGSLNVIVLAPHAAEAVAAALRGSGPASR